MGFETQEQAEAWAENMEFRAEQRKEEKMLHDKDERFAIEYQPQDDLDSVCAQARTLAIKDAEICALSYALRCTNNGFKVGADVAMDIAKEISAMNKERA